MCKLVCLRKWPYGYRLREKNYGIHSRGNVRNRGYASRGCFSLTSYQGANLCADLQSVPKHMAFWTGGVVIPKWPFAMAPPSSWNTDPAKRGGQGDGRRSLLTAYESLSAACPARRRATGARDRRVPPSGRLPPLPRNSPFPARLRRGLMEL